MDNTTAMGLAVFWGHESHQTRNGSRLKNTEKKRKKKLQIIFCVGSWNKRVFIYECCCGGLKSKQFKLWWGKTMLPGVANPIISILYRLCFTCNVYEMLCCIRKTLKMQSKAVAANHSHISQVVPTLHNDSFVWVSNHSTNQSAWSLSLLPNWGRSWLHYLDQNQSLAHFSFIFHPSKSRTGAADTAGKFPPPSASGNFGSVKLSGHMAGCTLELHVLFILSTRFIIHRAWSFLVRGLNDHDSIWTSATSLRPVASG